MPASRARTKAGKQRFVGKEMHRFKVRTLHLGKSGRVVKNRKQAVAISLRMAGLSRRKK